MKTLHDQREERRRAKLKHMQRQIKSGKLVVRQMTAEERGRNLPLPRKLSAPESGGPE
jgi:hypothetical protein